MVRDSIKAAIWFYIARLRSQLLLRLNILNNLSEVVRSERSKFRFQVPITEIQWRMNLKIGLLMPHSNQGT